MELKKKNVAVKVSGDLNTVFVSEKNHLFCFTCFEIRPKLFKHGRLWKTLQLWLK